MTLDARARSEPKSTLQKMTIHDAWSRQYRSGENDAFYALAFDYIASVLGDPNSASVLDAGCGSGTKAFELVKRGYLVTALDFSDSILERARADAAALGFDGRVQFSQGDLTALALPTGGVQRCVCWGVLMHVPDIGRAVSELSRVLGPGGVLIVSEGNLRSVQAATLRWIKRALGRERAEVIPTEAGIEFWEETSTGRLMTRQADIPWLVREFRRHGLELVQRRAGQFSEIYVILPWRPLRRLVHLLNNLWFRFPRLAGPAYGNLLVFRKP